MTRSFMMGQHWGMSTNIWRNMGSQRASIQHAAITINGQYGALWWQRPVYKIGSSHHQLFIWCAVVVLPGTALHCHALCWVLCFYLYTFVQCHMLVIIQWEELKFQTLLYSHYLDTLCGAQFSHGAELTGGLGDLYTGHITYQAQWFGEG